MQEFNLNEQACVWYMHERSLHYVMSIHVPCVHAVHTQRVIAMYEIF